MQTKRALLSRALAACLLSSMVLTGCVPASNPSDTSAGTTSAADMSQPANDGELNILLIGNSYSYYWPDELWGLMDAAGYKNLTICNVYYSGCTFEQHWTWHISGQSNYRFCINDSSGRRTEEGCNLEYCVSAKNWDIISLQQSNRYVYNGGEQAQRDSMDPYLPQLYNYLHEKFPNAKYYWLQSWAHDIGYGVDSIEQQKEVTAAFRNVAVDICKQYGFTNVPCGDAWELIRQDPLITEGGKTLTTRIRNGEPMYDDLTHDGDVGGGQYLNGCVWFEVLTGKSCVGNTFRPSYTLGSADLSLSEEKIALLQETAHKAVANVYGEDFAK